ncbi:winged helix-turn-helix domain-containing protein [Oxalobacteraceae bacterium CAVE-383]|nr:winged helix-turn-helix domain-containing protein [Oxalobacteraceae bacterium CAVE-383]
MSVTLTQSQARRIWLRAQRLDTDAPFGSGAEATRAAVEHLGYVQIDTINVIERCHHHILWTRIPDYRRRHLQQAQSVDKSVFEYWTHALSYVPTADLKYFIADMKAHAKSGRSRFHAATPAEVNKVIARIREDGALSIRDIDDDELVDKTHAWGSRKPSKRALQFAFYAGKLVVSERAGMLKTYELADRHFQWEKAPRPASQSQITDYLIDRALKSQGLVSLDSICHLNAPRKPLVLRAIESRVRRGTLLPAALAHGTKAQHWIAPAALDDIPDAVQGVHILSPFDPLIIQRKRLHAFFDYQHVFEAYVPKEKRRFGYFGLPVLVDGEIAAVLDLKADRERGKLLLQQWSWVGAGGRPARQTARHKKAIEEKLHRFEAFQFTA